MLSNTYTFLAVFLGGGLGSCLRFAISSWLNPISALLPLGTFLANILACFILGMAASLFQNKMANNELIRLFIMVGVCGGFSTFSTFSNELLVYWKSQQYGQLMIYSSLSLLSCHLAILAGMWLGKNLLA